MSMQVVVLAGGLATRMLPMTERIPKVLLPIAGRPFLDWLIDRLVIGGATELLLCIGHLGDRVVDHVGDGRAYAIPIHFSEDGPTPLGTAGSIAAASALLQEEFIVTYGDSYLPIDLRTPLEMLQNHREADAALVVWKNDNHLEPSNVAVEGDDVIRYDKTRSEQGATLDHIDFGAIAVRRASLDALPIERPIGLDVLQREWASRRKLVACRVNERFYEIGSPAGFADLETYLAQCAQGAYGAPR
jgi:N-acetyl-alpha-D-muramate 1-phosphate uridylyltransferase